MKRPGLTEIILGTLLLVSPILSYLHNTSVSSYFFPLIFVFIIMIITGVFMFVEYYNKNLYILIVTTVLVVMWALIYILPLSLGVDKIVYYLETVIITLLIVITVMDTIKKRNISQECVH